MKITKRKISATTSIKASRSDDMLAAFEDKLSEFDTTASTDVTCAEDVTCSKKVDVFDSDFDEYYTDSTGIFGVPGETYSLGEIKNYWNSDCESDPSCSAFASFDEWWNDTAQFLESTTPTYG